MTSAFTPRALVASFGLAATLGLSTVISGCGGSGQNAGDAVVITEPGATLPTPGASTTPAASSTTPTSAAAPAPAAAAKAEGWGTLKGQVVFGGTPPAPETLIDLGKAPKDPEVCAKDKPILSERLQVNATTKGVKNVLVYLPKPTAVNEEAKSNAAKTEVTFDQNKCVFEPHVLGVMVGSKLVLKSSDPVNHNINAKLQKNSPFNSILASGQSIPFSATTGERSPVQVTCDIHNWMVAWWLVLDNPYFAVTDANGNFEIKNVPAGTQKVVVWQEATSFVTPPSGEDVAIAANDATTKSFTIDPAKVKPAK